MNEDEITLFGTALDDIQPGQLVLIEPVEDNRIWLTNPETPLTHRDWKRGIALHDAKIGERVRVIVRGGTVPLPAPDSPYDVNLPFDE